MWKSDDPKKWKRVTFSGDRVIKLELDSNQPKSVPAEIGKLTSLEVLTLGGNQLTELPVEIKRLNC